MLTDWIHWLSCRHCDQLLLFLIGLLLTDGPRYALAKLLLCLWPDSPRCRDFVTKQSFSRARRS